MPILSVIAAIARNRTIGLDNTLPWRLPEDLKRFRAITTGHHIIMGRKTYESLGRLLPGRTTVIVSRNPAYQVPGAIVVESLQKAIAACGADAEVFVIGGAQLYREALPMADKLYLTLINADFEGDAHFPQYDPAGWSETSRESGVGGDGLGYDFVEFVRRG